MDRYQETFETWDKIAEIYQEEFMDLDLYHDTYDKFSKLISNPKASVLEIGCGPGNISKYLLTKNPVLKIKAIDISPNMIDLARKNNPTAEFVIMDSREIANLNDKFDAIICGFCIPYLSESDCLKLISDSEKLLNNFGILYISFVAGNYENSGYQTGSHGDRTYFYYHNLENIKRDLKRNAFEIVDLIEKKYNKPDGTKEIHTVLITKKINAQ